MTEVQQGFVRQGFFVDGTPCWDNRRREEIPLHPEFRHKKDAFWLNNRQKPVSVQSPTWNGRKNWPPEFSSTAVRGASGTLASREADLEIRNCLQLCEDGTITDAVDALSSLVQRRCRVPNDLFYRALKRCIARKELVLGRRIHALTVKSGCESHPFLATHLIGLYASHGRLEEAIGVFGKVSVPDAYNWATIIFAYARHGEAAQAIRLYRQMCKTTVQPDNHIFLAVLQACASAGDLAAGKDVHAHIIASAEKPSIYVQTCLVDMYAKCGSIGDARSVFDRLPQKNVVTWTAMIAGYAQQGMGQEALSLYSRMQGGGMAAPNSVTFVCLLQACAGIGEAALREGKRLHSQIKERGLQDDVVLGGSLVSMYAKCGSIGDAHSVFVRLSHKNVVTWSAMMAGYVQQGMGQEALNLYSSMLEEGTTSPDIVTFVCLLQACLTAGVEEALRQGKQLHAHIEARGLQDHMVVGASLVNMYAKLGSTADARRVFDRIPQKDGVTWTSMIAGYAQQGMGQEALNVYRCMQQQGIPPNPVTYVSLLQACAAAAELPLGKQLHVQIAERGLQDDVVVGTALVNMYAKCGSMCDSQQVFDSLPERNIEAWSALIAGYTLQGGSASVFALVDSMRQQGIQPNGVTFLSVLTVCSHVGLVDKGREYFKAMRTDYAIVPSIEHYICVMDLLGRAGHLDEALQMAKTMPFPATGAVWHTLLSACRKWNDVQMGRQVFDLAVGLDDRDASAYILMSSIYSGARMWDEAKEMKARRVKSKAWKQPGQSWWTDMDGVVHTFTGGDQKLLKMLMQAETAGPPQ